jgi:hypothetical protein
MKPDDVRRSLSDCGFAPDQISRACAPSAMSVSGSNTVIHPDSELVFSLSPQTRIRLYNELDQFSANEYIRFPFFLREKAFEDALRDCQFDSKNADMVRSLTYRRGDYVCLSDLEAALQRIPSDEQRLKLVKVLSRQTVVMARLRIRPTTDIDKVLNYWTSAPGVRVTNLRPLLESYQRLPDGGSVSLMYLLPPFARDRLYTYPLSSYTESWMDCGWSALNFFNPTNDNRFADPNYFRSYLTANYYRVDKATHYGDLILVLDRNDKVVHSAVYVADDLVFTKNGANYTQPWTLMRIKDMLTFFEGMNARNILILRNNRI